MKKLVLVAAAALAAAACGSGERHAPEQRSLPEATVNVVQLRSETQGGRVPALIQPIERATIATRQPARVRSVEVREGDTVKAGAVLVSLADEDLRAQLAAASSALVTARAQESRLQRLAAQGAATKSELETAQAQRAQAQAQVGAAREALQYTVLRAPFDGRVQAKHVNPGDLVTTGAPLVEVEGTGLEVVATLSGDELARIKQGQPLGFEVTGGTGKAEVTAIAPSADPVAHRSQVRARVVEAPQGLRAGSFARLELPASDSAKSQPWVPTSALVQRGDLRGVFVARNGHAELQWLLLGDEVAGAVPVRAGLKGDELLVDSPADLKDGQPIKVANAP